MTGILGKKILELYGSDNEDARYDLSIEIVVILDKIADLIAKNIDDVSQLENVAMKQTIVNAIRDAKSKSDDVRRSSVFYVKIQFVSNMYGVIHNRIIDGR